MTSREWKNQIMADFHVSNQMASGMYNAMLSKLRDMRRSQHPIEVWRAEDDEKRTVTSVLPKA